jgi:hypothetical protein
MPARLTAALCALALAPLGAQLVGFSGAAFTAQKQNPGNSFQAAASFCTSPGEQVVSASRDSYVDSLSANSNFGSATQLLVRPAQVLVLSQRRALVGFNLPSIPSRCTLTAATLRLYATSPGGGRTINVLRLNGSWTEAGVAWNNAPATTGTAASSASLSSAGWQSWNVLAHVQAMYSGTNNGFLVKDSQDSAVASVQQTYQSREGTPNGQDPELRLTFG